MSEVIDLFWLGLFGASALYMVSQMMDANKRKNEPHEADHQNFVQNAAFLSPKDVTWDLDRTKGLEAVAVTPAMKFDFKKHPDHSIKWLIRLKDNSIVTVYSSYNRLLQMLNEKYDIKGFHEPTHKI